jgi:hypothetical protein
MLGFGAPAALRTEAKINTIPTRNDLRIGGENIIPFAGHASLKIFLHNPVALKLISRSKALFDDVGFVWCVTGTKRGKPFPRGFRQSVRSRMVHRRADSTSVIAFATT